MMAKISTLPALALLLTIAAPFQKLTASPINLAATLDGTVGVHDYLTENYGTILGASFSNWRITDRASATFLKSSSMFELNITEEPGSVWRYNEPLCHSKHSASFNGSGAVSTSIFSGDTKFEKEYNPDIFIDSYRYGEESQMVANSDFGEHDMDELELLNQSFIFATHEGAENFRLLLTSPERNPSIRIPKLEWLNGTIVAACVCESINSYKSDDVGPHIKECVYHKLQTSKNQKADCCRALCSDGTCTTAFAISFGFPIFTFDFENPSDTAESAYMEWREYTDERRVAACTSRIRRDLKGNEPPSTTPQLLDCSISQMKTFDAGDEWRKCPHLVLKELTTHADKESSKVILYLISEAKYTATNRLHGKTRNDYLGKNSNRFSYMPECISANSMNVSNMGSPKTKCNNSRENAPVQLETRGSCTLPTFEKVKSSQFCGCARNTEILRGPTFSDGYQKNEYSNLKGVKQQNQTKLMTPHISMTTGSAVIENQVVRTSGPLRKLLTEPNADSNFASSAAASRFKMIMLGIGALILMAIAGVALHMEIFPEPKDHKKSKHRKRNKSQSKDSTPSSSTSPGSASSKGRTLLSSTEKYVPEPTKIDGQHLEVRINATPRRPKKGRGNQKLGALYWLERSEQEIDDENESTVV